MEPERSEEGGAALAYLSLLRHMATTLDELITARSRGSSTAPDPSPPVDPVDGEEEDVLAALLLGAFSRELAELPVDRLRDMRHKVSVAALPLLNAIVENSA